MSAEIRLLVSALVQFVITATSALTMHMVVKEAVVMPTPAIWLLILAMGLASAAKDVQAVLQAPPK